MWREENSRTRWMGVLIVVVTQMMGRKVLLLLLLVKMKVCRI